ncbi:hypothetical protein [Propioniciclava coleopterorum]|uniref:hypothetical protein n=1 Tax=Propioniciclava coleopterorum TaxID=2714937 RepID=UPI00197D071C|nr:hypothetical protein [Propioniciclava coleopterorum]
MEASYRWKIQPRFFVVLAVLAGLIAVIWGGAALVGELSRPKPPELPRGGRTIFPEYRLFGYSGYPGRRRWGASAPATWMNGWRRSSGPAPTTWGTASSCPSWS